MSTVALSKQPSHEIDLDVQRLVLDVVSRKLRGLDTRIDGSITGGELERTMDGASTLTITVHDPKRALLLSGMFAEKIEVRLDRLLWRLVKVGKHGDELTLTFEDREVALLREQTQPKKASRAKVTRAEFALSLVREAGTGIPFVCPELHVRQDPIENKRQQRSDTVRNRNREKGLAAGANLTVKGAAATRSQLKNAERALDVADSLNAGEKATLALVEALIVESEIKNLGWGDRDSRGVLQVRDSTASGMGIDNMDVSQVVNAFLTRGYYHDPQLGGGGAIAIARRHPDASAGRVAQATQGSAFPNEYDKRAEEAQRFLDAYNGAGVTSLEVVKKLPYQFRRGGESGGRESSWDALQRLAEEVNWRCFVSAGSVYFVSETALMKSKPRLTLSERTVGVSAIDFDVDDGKVRNEASVTCRAARWAAAPGAVVELEECGPADGRWLVHSIRRGLFEADASITLKRPTKPLREPAPETMNVTSKAAASQGMYASADFAGGESNAIDAVYQAAQAMHAKRYPYVWGGGHGAAGTPSGTYPGYDCSGSTCAILAAAGLGYELGGRVDVSGTIGRSWGQPGKGRRMTVYANDVHVFVVFHTSGGDQHFGTGDWGKGWGGAGFNPRMHHLTGFNARHWPGT